MTIRPETVPETVPETETVTATETATATVSVSVVWSAGPDAGGSVALRPGRHFVGRATGAAVRCDDDALALHHAVLDVGEDGVVRVLMLAAESPGLDPIAATDGWSRLRPGERVALGASLLELTAPAPTGGSPVGGALGTVAPPALLPTPRADGHLLPTGAGVGAAALASAVLGQPLLAVFGLLGGLVGFTVWCAPRLHRTRVGVRAARAHAAALADFHADMARQRERSRAELILRAPSLGRVWAILGDPVRRCAPGLPPAEFSVSIGVGSIDGGVPLISSRPAAQGASALFDDAGRVDHVPIVTNLAPGAVIAGAGDEWDALRKLAQCVPTDPTSAPYRQAWQLADRVVGDNTVPLVVVLAEPSLLAIAAGPLAGVLAQQPWTTIISVVADATAVPANATSIVRIGRHGAARWVADTSVSTLAEPVHIAGVSPRSAARAVGYLTHRRDPVTVTPVCLASSPWGPPSSAPFNGSTPVPMSCSV